MIKGITVLMNLGIVIWLGYRLSLCVEPEHTTYFDIAQDPFVLSFVAVVALFVATSH
ncbi:MAG: hypothetical protein JW943_03990 [Deltaproteobacteria bacterium]|nr:hypothetical protein [Deltaproteobacteria bacterium]